MEANGGWLPYLCTVYENRHEEITHNASNSARFIKSEGNYLIVSNIKFEKFEDLAEYYGRDALHNDIKCVGPYDDNVSKALLRMSFESISNIKAYNSLEYCKCYVKNVKGTVRAMQNVLPAEGDSHLLSMKKGDIIVGVEKVTDGWWYGIRQDQQGEQHVQPKLFCSSFVEECEELDGPFGDIHYKESIDLGKGAKWTKCYDKNGMNYYLNLKYPNGTKIKLGAKCSMERMEEWVAMINSVVEKDHEKRKKLAKARAETENKIASEYSDLIIYCKSMSKLEPEHIGTDKDNIDVTLVKSLDETSAARKFRSNPPFYVWYHQFAATRIYPKGNRVNSSNLSPVQFWNFGSQMVALNWQTGDKAMQWNRGKFRENGNCGYVLKPSFMFPERLEQSKSQFDPTRMNENDFCDGIQLKIDIISARHLNKQTSGPISPCVEVEITGIDADCKKVQTPASTLDTGLNPYWNHHFFFKVRCPELALLQFSVHHLDAFSDKLLLGECTIPVKCIREGF